MAKTGGKGRSVIIVWECELKRANFEETIDRVVGEIVRTGEAYRATQEERKKHRKSIGGRGESGRKENNPSWKR